MNNIRCWLLLSFLISQSRGASFTELTATNYNGSNKFIGSASVGAKVYAVSAAASRVIAIDTTSYNSSNVGNLSLSCSECYVSTVAVGSRVYSAPYNAEKVLVIDSITGEVRHHAQAHNGSEKYSACLRVGWKVVCAPYSASHVLVIDGQSDSSYRIGSNFTGEAKYRGCANASSVVYCAPYQSDTVLKIDAANEIVTQIGPTIGGNYKYASCVAVQEGSSRGKIVCAPYLAGKVLIINSNTDTVIQLTDQTYQIFAYVACAPVFTRVFCAPIGGEKSVLVVDTVNEASTQLSEVYTTSPTYEQGSCAALGLTIFCAPSDAPSVLVIDTSRNMSYQLGTIQYGLNKYRSCTPANGRVICPPYDAKYVLAISPDSLAPSTSAPSTSVAPSPIPSISPTLSPSHVSIRRRCVLGEYQSVADINVTNSIIDSYIDKLRLPDGLGDTYGCEFRWHLSLTPGVHNFTLESNDGTRLYINNTLVVDNDGVHKKRTRSGSFDTTNHNDEFRLLYSQHFGTTALSLTIDGYPYALPASENTIAPTMNYSLSPTITMNPVANPAPTMIPSASPLIPSPGPTSSPSDSSLTPAPTTNPSAGPLVPSQVPTTGPSVNPQAPTSPIPSQAPTMNPSASPLNLGPTHAPPTSIPTSLNPSGSPTHTSSPSLVTNTPQSLSPTSIHASDFPTAAPATLSYGPTQMPSDTLQPTSNPTLTTETPTSPALTSSAPSAAPVLTQAVFLDVRFDEITYPELVEEVQARFRLEFRRAITLSQNFSLAMINISDIRPGSTMVESVVVMASHNLAIEWTKRINELTQPDDIFNETYGFNTTTFGSASYLFAYITKGSGASPLGKDKLVIHNKPVLFALMGVAGFILVCCCINVWKRRASEHPVRAYTRYSRPRGSRESLSSSSGRSSSRKKMPKTLMSSGYNKVA